MKQRVVFLFYHGLGHIIAFSKIARILEEAQYEVYFAGVGFFHQYVSSQGFKSYALKTNPFGMGFETWVNTVEKGKHVYFSALRDRIKDRLCQDRNVELYWMLEELKPSIVLIDALQSTDFIVLYPHLKNRGIKTAIVHTTLPMHVIPGHPPLNSDVFPDDKDAVKRAFQLMKWDQFKKTIAKKIIHWGFDDQFLIRRRVKKNSIPKYYISKSPSLLNFSLKNVDEFVIAAREFEFPDFIPESTQHYIGFMTNEVRTDQTENAYKNASPLIFQLKKERNLKLIYCSFGTIEPKEMSDIFFFLKKIIQITEEEDYILIISLKAKDDDIKKLRASGNIYIFNFVPQLEVLKQSDLFITHGGLNSIKEGINAEVPMLLYPIHPRYDPYGNAARIVYHGLGLRGNATTDSLHEIKEKVKELLSNPFYKKNVREMKRQDFRYTADNLLQKINSIKPLSI